MFQIEKTRHFKAHLSQAFHSHDVIRRFALNGSTIRYATLYSTLIDVFEFDSDKETLELSWKGG